MSAAVSLESFIKRQQLLQKTGRRKERSGPGHTHTQGSLEAHNCCRYQRVKLSVCRIRIGFMSKPKTTQIPFNGAKVYTCSWKWDLQDQVFTSRAPHSRWAPAPAPSVTPNRAWSNDTSRLVHRVNSWMSSFLLSNTSFSFQSLSFSLSLSLSLFLSLATVLWRVPLPVHTIPAPLD